MKPSACRQVPQTLKFVKNRLSSPQHRAKIWRLCICFATCPIYISVHKSWNKTLKTLLVSMGKAYSPTSHPAWLLIGAVTAPRDSMRLNSRSTQQRQTAVGRTMYYKSRVLMISTRLYKKETLGKICLSSPEMSWLRAKSSSVFPQVHDSFVSYSEP